MKFSIKDFFSKCDQIRSFPCERFSIKIWTPKVYYQSFHCHSTFFPYYRQKQVVEKDRNWRWICSTSWQVPLWKVIWKKSSDFMKIKNSILQNCYRRKRRKNVEFRRAPLIWRMILAKRGNTWWRLSLRPKQKTAGNCFRKRLHLRCLTGIWIHLPSQHSKHPDTHFPRCFPNIFPLSFSLPNK